MSQKLGVLFYYIKKYIYCYLKCIVYDKLLKHRQSFWITMYTLGWPYTEGNWLYCDYFIWCVSCTVVILTCFVMCVCFGNICTCIYCVFVLFRLCIFILICFVRTNLRTTAIGWQINCSNDDDDDDDDDDATTTTMIIIIIITSNLEVVKSYSSYEK